MPKFMGVLALMAALTLSACAVTPQSCCGKMMCCNGKMACCHDGKGCCCCNGKNVRGCPYNYKK